MSALRPMDVVAERDIILRCVAEGADPDGTHVCKLAEGKPLAIGFHDFGVNHRALADLLRRLT